MHRIAHGRSNLGIHQPVVGFVLEFQHPRRAFAGVQCAGILNGHFPCLMKEGGPHRPAGCGICHRRIVDLFKDSRHAQDQVGAGPLEFHPQGGEIRPVGLSTAADGHGQGYRPRQHVGQRQEREHPGAGTSDGPDGVGEQTVHLGKPIGVGESAAFRPAGGAGGVHQ